MEAAIHGAYEVYRRNSKPTVLVYFPPPGFIYVPVICRYSEAYLGTYLTYLGTYGESYTLLTM